MTGRLRPEEELIRRARNSRRLSIPAAAERASISQQRWAQIERSVGNAAPPETIAHMAHAVGITSDRLVGIRDDAAEILKEIELQATSNTFDHRIREIIALVPEVLRSDVERLYADYQDAQETQDRVFEALLSLLAKLPKSAGREDN